MCLQTLSADLLLGMCCYDAELMHVLHAGSGQTRDMAGATLYDSFCLPLRLEFVLPHDGSVACGAHMLAFETVAL